MSNPYITICEVDPINSIRKTWQQQWCDQLAFDPVAWPCFCPPSTLIDRCYKHDYFTSYEHDITDMHDTRCYGVTYPYGHGVIYHCDYVECILHKEESSMPTIYRLAKWINY